MTWTLADVPLSSRFILGTAGYPSPQILVEAIEAAEAEVVTVSLRRQVAGRDGQPNAFWDLLRGAGRRFLPNTAGCHRAHEALVTAQMAREVFETHWIKLEVTGDDYNLQPDPFETVEAATALIRDGFEVFAYCTDDLVVCQRLADSGCRVLMPWGAPIGSGRGLLNPYALRTIRERLPDLTLLIDAGIGSPADAVSAMQMGYDGILLNSAVSQSADPVRMAQAFRLAIEAGRLAYQAGVMEPQERAVPTTPLIGVPFWQQGPRGG
ncbi:MAG: thiazole synthase [Thermoanaerobaculia bacterium]